jgi:hypothetical protein
MLNPKYSLGEGGFCEYRIDPDKIKIKMKENLRSMPVSLSYQRWRIKNKWDGPDI